MTNFERIKSMSVDKLAEIIMCPAEYDLDFNRAEDCYGDMSKNCIECCKKWLESEAATNDT